MKWSSSSSSAFPPVLKLETEESFVLSYLLSSSSIQMLNFNIPIDIHNLMSLLFLLFLLNSAVIV